MAEQVPLIGPAGAAAELLTPPRNAILVGGQALALWVNALGVALPPALEGGVTYDVDFFGTREDAEDHHKFLEAALQGRELRAEVRFPEPFELTPNSAKITVYRGDDIAAEIDYLGSVIGYGELDKDRLRRRAILVEGMAARPLLVMSPFDCLRSRIHNLFDLPNKRGPFSVAQTRLAITVLNSYLSAAIKATASARDLLYPIAEEIIALAASREGVSAFDNFGVDVMEALPTDSYPPEFRERRLTGAWRYIVRRREGRRGGRVRVAKAALAIPVE